MVSLSFVIVCVGLGLLVQFVRMLKRGKELKADRWMLLSTLCPINFAFPDWLDLPGIAHGLCYSFDSRYSDFERLGKDGYVEVSMTSPTDCVVFIADPQAYKEITRPRAPFVRPAEALKKFLGLFGDNMFTLEGEEWKLHRKIGHRAFTETPPTLVWNETMTVIEQLFEIWDLNPGQKVRIGHAKDMTKTLTLMVISSAALGHRLSWTEDYERPWPGFTMSFQKAVGVVSTSLVERVFTPKWADELTEKTRTMSAGFDELERYLRQMIETHRNRGQQLHDSSSGDPSSKLVAENVFSVLVAASDQNAIETGRGLTDQDVIGNAFLFIFAGHDTSASALAFTLGLLALYPQVQQEVHEQIKQVMGSRSHLDYADMEKLKLVTGAFWESLRMYPVTSFNTRIAERDTVLSVARNSTGREDIIVPANSRVLISHAAIHYNPKYWPEPEEFRPSRFSGAYNRDAFVPFSTGGKACLGQKFAEAEATATIAAILARYEVSVDSSLFPDIPGEGIRARRERLLRPEHMMSVAPRKVPLVFTRRYA
ncbi:hypothetical protein FRC06_001209 [Ceratobasidium sp. 370]|nr:hypothetical protein FRC06_001209 [Ceratobasidium sp. 370]